jgi:hypothetical protein
MDNVRPETPVGIEWFEGESTMALRLLTQQNTEYKRLLDECAEADHLTILVGAGASAEAGLPTWRELISRYLNIAIELRRQDSVLDAHGLDVTGDIPGLLVESFPEAQRLATLGDMLVGENRRRSVLSLALYNSSREFKPGPSAVEVARLYEIRSRKRLQTHIVTTNFDDLLERGFSEIGFKWALNSKTLDDLSEEFEWPESEIADTDHNDTTGRRKHVNVWHLHGYLPPRELAGKEPILFSEREYALNYTTSVNSLAPLMLKGPSLFIGLSMADWDLITAAHYVNDIHHEVEALERDSGVPAPYHFAMALEGSWTTSPELLKRLDRSRLESMGLHSFKNLRSYSQIPQVIHEIGTRTRLGSTYWNSQARYSCRLRQWQDDFDKAFPSGVEEGLGNQAELSDDLAADLQGIREKLGLEVVADSLGIHLWARVRDEYKMMLWLSSEYARRAGASPGYTVPIADDDRFLALKRAYFGTPSDGFVAVPSSRWKQVMAVPIIATENEPWGARYGRLLVGVCTLSTNLNTAESDISQSLLDDSELQEALLTEVAAVGRKFLLEKCTSGVRDPVK